MKSEEILHLFEQFEHAASEVGNHFPDIRKMVEIGSRTERVIRRIE